MLSEQPGIGLLDAFQQVHGIDFPPSGLWRCRLRKWSARPRGFGSVTIFGRCVDEQRDSQHAQREITQDPGAHRRALARYNTAAEDIDHPRKLSTESRIFSTTFNHRFN